MDISEITTVNSDGITMNASKLPKVQYFRVQLAGTTGKRGERHATGYLVLVKCEGENELVNAPDIAARYGMKLRHNNFRTREAAIEGGKTYAAKWGMPTSAKGKKTEEEKAKAVKEATDAAVGKIIGALKAMGLSEEVVKAIVAKAN